MNRPAPAYRHTRAVAAARATGIISSGTIGIK
jgi:hypothetical protein